MKLQDIRRFLNQTKKPSLSGGRRLLMAAALTLVLALSAASAPARAGLVMSIGGIQGPTGGAGSFEVLLTNTGATATEVGGFSFALAITGGEFTGAFTETVAAAYIFQGTGGASVDPFFQFSYDVFPSESLTASDTEWLSPTGGGSVAPGALFSLGLITYSTGSAQGPVLVSFLSAGTSIADPSGDGITFEAPQGPTEVGGGGVIPEPSSWILAGLGLAGLAFGRALKLNRGAVSG